MIKAIFTNIKNENRYLEEWINWHIKLGFNKFILFEDYDSVSHLDIINKYANIINIDFYDYVLKKDSIEFKDITCFKYILENYNNIDWIIKLDPDEYISLPNEMTIDDLLYNVRENINQITIDWKIYNANGFINCPYGGKYSLVNTYLDYIDVENFVNDFDLNISNNEYDWGKTILRYKYFYQNYRYAFDTVISTNYPYQFYVDEENSILDATKKYGAYINHYMTKSFEEFYFKLTNKGDYRKNYRKLGDFFKINPDMIKDIPMIEEEYKINVFNQKTKLNFKAEEDDN